MGFSGLVNAQTHLQHTAHGNLQNTLENFAHTEIQFTDDAGQLQVFKAPAQRIVSLAPHITELLFFVGAGDAVVGVMQHSDFPAQAKKIPVVGQADQLDYERIMRLKPDVVIAWGGITANPRLEKLRSMGLRIVYSDPQTLQAIAQNMQWLAILTGRQNHAEPLIQQWRTRLSQLQYAASNSNLTVFYQVWNQPLLTVSRQQIIGQAVALCGAQVLFGGMSHPTPMVSLEAVVRANPDIIVFSERRQVANLWLKQWQQWPQIKAVRKGQLFILPPDLLVRPGPRFLDGVQRLCEVIETVQGTEK